MSSIYFTQEHHQFRDQVRGFLKEAVLPHVSQWEEDGCIPAEAWKTLGSEGYLGLNYPTAYGGGDKDIFHSVVWWEEMGRTGYAGFRVAVALHANMAISYLAKYGSEYLKRTFLVPAIAGEKLAALALTEPQGGSDLSAIETRAEREGDHFVVNGVKKYIIHSTTADFIIAAVKTGTSSASARPGATGVSLLLIDANAPGVHRKRLKNVGFHCTDTGELVFENVRVPVENIVGKENQGFLHLMKNLQLERLSTGCMAIGGADACLDETWRFVTNRQISGGPLSRFQALRHRLADQVAQTEMARQFSYHAAWLYDQGKLPVAECSIIKLQATELAKRAVHECMQFFGAQGFEVNSLISVMYRDVQAPIVGAGANDVMRDLIAQMTLDESGWRRKNGK